MCVSFCCCYLFTIYSISTWMWLTRRVRCVSASCLLFLKYWANKISCLANMRTNILVLVDYNLCCFFEKYLNTHFSETCVIFHNFLKFVVHFSCNNFFCQRKFNKFNSCICFCKIYGFLICILKVADAHLNMNYW